MSHWRATTPVRLLTSLILFGLLLGCAQPPAVEPSPPSPTLVPTQAATSTPVPMPTDTQPPEPTALPGVQVIPLDSMAHQIPWLPQDKSRNPFSAYYGFNYRQPPFNNLLVRQAFATAVDKEAVAQLALEFKMREAVPAMTLTPSAILGRELYGEMGVPYEPGRARDLLAQAGYVTSASFPHTTLIVYMRSSAAPGIHYRIAEAVADMWTTHLGVTVEIEAVESPASMIAILQREPKSMFVLGWGADYLDPDNYLKALFHSQSDNNHGHFYSPEFDRLVDQAAALGDPAERQALYIQAEYILSEREVALIPLFHSLGYQP